MNAAILTPSARRRMAAAAYPFYACMIKQGFLLAAAAVLFAGGIYFGHVATTQWPGPGHWFAGGRPVDTEVMEKLTAELDLTPGQRQQIAPIVKAACANLRLLSEQHRAQRLEALDEISTTIAPGLSPDQQKRLEALQGELQNKKPVKRDLRIVALF